MFETHMILYLTDVDIISAVKLCLTVQKNMKTDLSVEKLTTMTVTVEGGTCA